MLVISIGINVNYVDIFTFVQLAQLYISFRCGVQQVLYFSLNEQKMQFLSSNQAKFPHFTSTNAAYNDPQLDGANLSTFMS